MLSSFTFLVWKVLFFSITLVLCPHDTRKARGWTQVMLLA